MLLKKDLLKYDLFCKEKLIFKRSASLLGKTLILIQWVEGGVQASAVSSTPDESGYHILGNTKEIIKTNMY